MADSVFYWECRGDKYDFDKDKNYLIYFRCCSCPPSAGHYNTVKRFTDLGDNIHVMIHHIGSESRHGVPYYLNRKIWKTFIIDLLPEERIHLIKCRDSYDILDLEILDNIDTIVYVRGNEEYDIREKERSNRRNFKKIMKKLWDRYGIDMHFYYLDRPEKSWLSATQFIKSLKERKRKCCGGRNKDCDRCLNKLSIYLPEDLSRNKILKIVNSLQKHRLII